MGLGDEARGPHLDARPTMPHQGDGRRALKVVIANFSLPTAPDRADDFWRRQRRPAPPAASTLLEQRLDWGFHLFALGLHLRDLGVADEVEFWDYGAERGMRYRENGVLWVTFLGPEDIRTYRECHGEAHLFINYGSVGEPVLQALDGQCFRVHVPCFRGPRHTPNRDAECYLVDDERYLDARAMIYVPVVHPAFRPSTRPKERDFVYLASAYDGKRHDLLLDAVRGSALTGHLHPVAPDALDLQDTRITTSNLNERDVVDLLQTSRIAVYPGDRTSNPAAMWECVAAGLPIVVNAEIAGGRHVVVPGVTGEVAPPERFGAVMRDVLARRDAYRPAQHFAHAWNTRALLDAYLDFFVRMGWERPTCS